MRNTRLLKQIIRGAIAEREWVRWHMDKINRNMALSVDAFTQFGNATYQAGEAAAELAKALKDQQ